MDLNRNVVVIRIREVPKDGLDLEIAMLYPREEALTDGELEELRQSKEWKCVLSEEDGLDVIEVYRRKR